MPGERQGRMSHRYRPRAAGPINATRQGRGNRLKRDQRASPLATCPRSRNVLGYERLPQSLKEPKSLYSLPPARQAAPQPTGELIQIRDAELAVTHQVDQMLPHPSGQVFPALKLRH